jgi:putative queuosine salvage protein
MSASPIDNSVPGRVRAACAWVAGRASSVSIEEGTIGVYATSLTPEGVAGIDVPIDGKREQQAALAICLNAINFGSGWWPTIRKRPGLSGYSTIAAGVTARFRESSGWTAQELTRLSATEVAAVLDQDDDHPLMEQFATSLRDVGVHVCGEHGGRFEVVVDTATGSAVELAGILAGWESFADVSIYDDRQIPFYKRAQLAAADVDRAGVVRLEDSARLTAFADNLVPHVLRLDGVLRLDPGLERAIEAGQLLEHGSPQEVELRACAVHAIELLSAATGGRLSPAEIDGALWNRGSGPTYKARPRPRSRNTAY